MSYKVLYSENKCSWWNKLGTLFLQLPFGPGTILCTFIIVQLYTASGFCVFVLWFFWQESRQLGERGRAKRNDTEGQRSYDNQKGRLSQQFLSGRAHLYGKGISPKFHAQNRNFLQELVFSFRNPTTVKLCKLIAPIPKQKKLHLSLTHVIGIPQR